MYLHLGGDRLVRLNDVVAILEAGASAARACAARAQERGAFEASHEGPVHAYVVTRDRVYASPISTATLLRRARQAFRGLLEG